MNGGRPIVSVRGVEKSFGEIAALRGVDLDVATGEVVCIIGPSGCGKSTFLNTINWLEQPDAGAVYINGEQVGDGAGGSSIAEGWGLGARVGMNVDDARPFTGLMDDLSIWKRGLTADEVAAIMDAGAIPAGAAVDAAGKATTTWAVLRR